MTDTFETTETGVSDQAGQTEAAPSSILAGLRAQREAILTRTFDLPVPGYDGAIFVRFKPVQQELLSRAEKRLEQAEKHPHLGWEANALILAASVVGVYALDNRGKPVLVDSQFSSAVAEGFGEAAERAIDVVKIVYVDDVAIADTVNKLTDWTRTNKDEAIEEFEGN